MKVIMNSDLDFSNTMKVGELHCSYRDLVKVFGRENSEGDGWKVEFEWIGTINGEIFTLYNWKDGKKYSSSGLSKTQIKEWHIGAKNGYVGQKVKEYFEMMIKSGKEKLI